MRKAYRLFKQITLVVDAREQRPYRFSHPTVTAPLPTGDYSLLGLTDKVAMECKSFEDLVNSLKGSRWEGFAQGLQQSRCLDYFALVVEYSLSDLAAGNYRRYMTPAFVVQSVITRGVRYRVPVWLADSREIGVLGS